MISQDPRFLARLGLGNASTAPFESEAIESVTRNKGHVVARLAKMDRSPTEANIANTRFLIVARLMYHSLFVVSTHPPKLSSGNVCSGACRLSSAARVHGYILVT